MKRIVGLPGDTIEYRDGKLILNGKPCRSAISTQEFTDERGVKMQRARGRISTAAATTCSTSRPRPGRPTERITVPADRYFMMGDNRDNSNDSRAWGTVHRNDLKGPVLINYWSWNNSELARDAQPDHLDPAAARRDALGPVRHDVRVRVGSEPAAPSS